VNVKPGAAPAESTSLALVLTSSIQPPFRAARMAAH
jgi:hypothetical protein